ncbi:replication protein [Acetobacter pasteurianus NBRC 3299]|nr:replication protein [Acetobacter pasteurianus NBRC 3299]
MRQPLELKERKSTNWVQTPRAAHEAWAALISKSPKAATIMHLLTARLGENNAVVISQKNLAKLAKIKSLTTVKSALSLLEADRWIEIRQIGQNGTVNAYVVNDRVAWSGPRDGIRYSLFSATVIASSDEQPDKTTLGHQHPLRRLPDILDNERQLPSGQGLPPPSQPLIDGLEPDLPARQHEAQQTGIKEFTS